MDHQDRKATATTPLPRAGQPSQPEKLHDMAPSDSTHNGAEPSQPSVHAPHMDALHPVQSNDQLSTLAPKPAASHEATKPTATESKPVDPKPAEPRPVTPMPQPAPESQLAAPPAEEDVTDQPVTTDKSQHEHKPVVNKPPKAAKQPGIGLAIFATIVIILGLGMLATYAYLRSTGTSLF